MVLNINKQHSQACNFTLMVLAASLNPDRVQPQSTVFLSLIVNYVIDNEHFYTQVKDIDYYNCIDRNGGTYGVNAMEMC